MTKKQSPNFLQISWALEIQDLQDEALIYDKYRFALIAEDKLSEEEEGTYSAYVEHILDPLINLKKRRLEALLALEEAMQKNYFLKDLREDVGKLYKGEVPIIEILLAKYFDWNPKGPKPKEGS